jgi:hypothetical protein
MKIFGIYDTRGYLLVRYSRRSDEVRILSVRPFLKIAP